ncbi:MAG: bacterial Ig-like domain-containing protein [Bacteroidaceae bacterium]|nr:bacterial Ig-like domain-containing protein [Bacteroidaceae bacterium]
MKQHLLKNSFLRGVLCLLLCVVGLGNAWGEEVKVTFDASAQGYANGQVITDVTITEGITVTFDKGTNSNPCKYYNTGTAIRVYGGGYFTIASTIGKIIKIKLIFGSGDGSNEISKDSGTYYSSTGTWEGSSESITFTIGGTTGHRRIKTIAVTYQSSTTPDVPTPELESINFEAANNIEYYVGEEVTEQGLTVTAYYNDESSANVTENVEAWKFTPGTINSTDIKSINVEFDYEGKTYGPYNFTITVRSIANTAESAYTVAQACAYIDAGKGLSEEVYVKGIVSQVDEFKEKFGSITYWISEDGTTTGQQFQCYGGLNIGGEKFTSIDDLKLGTAVVVKGHLIKYNNTTYELNTNNVLISKDESNAKTLSSIEIEGEPSKTSYYIGDTPSAEGLAVNAVYSDNSKVDVTAEVTWTFDPETLTEEGSVKVTATAKYGEDQVEIVFDVTVAAAPIEYTYTLDLTTKTYYEATEAHVYWNANVANLATYRKNSNTTAANNYLGGDANSRTSSRFYKNNTVTLTSKANVTQFVFYTTSDSYAKALFESTYTNASATRETGSNNIVITPTSSGSQISITMASTCGCTAMKVYYQPTTVEISSAGLATFCLPYNATVPEGLTAYTATDNDESIRLTAKEDDKEGRKIAANEGVVLKGDEGTYTFVAAEGNVNPTAGNQLVGVTEDTELTEADNAYMLTRKIDDGSIAFRLLKTNYTLGANKAYLKVDDSANTRELIPAIWDDNATGIDNIAKDEVTATGAIYNLAGQKLMRAQKGINIINGKLVIK